MLSYDPDRDFDNHTLNYFYVKVLFLEQSQQTRQKPKHQTHYTTQKKVAMNSSTLHRQTNLISFYIQFSLS